MTPVRRACSQETDASLVLYIWETEYVYSSYPHLPWEGIWRRKRVFFFFCTVPRHEIYLACFMSLCEHLCSTNTKVEEKRRWYKFTSSQTSKGFLIDRSGYNKRDKLHLYLHLPRYLMEEKVQIVMGRFDIQQYTLALKWYLEMTPGPS